MDIYSVFYHRQVCPALRLCPQPSELSSEQSSEQSSELSSEESHESSVESSEEAGSSGLLSPAAVESGEGCAICEYAMNTLLNFLKDKKTEVSSQLVKLLYCLA